jgi:hypothetical protein
MSEAAGQLGIRGCFGEKSTPQQKQEDRKYFCPRNGGTTA